MAHRQGLGGFVDVRDAVSRHQRAVLLVVRHSRRRADRALPRSRRSRARRAFSARVRRLNDNSKKRFRRAAVAVIGRSGLLSAAAGAGCSSETCHENRWVQILSAGKKAGSVWLAARAEDAAVRWRLGVRA